jgi:uncharacterized protein (TIGR03066 family)
VKLRNLAANIFSQSKHSPGDGKMKILLLALAGTVCLACGSLADEKKDKKTEEKKRNLLGVWEIVDGGDIPAGATAEFTKDGKLRIAMKVKDQNRTAEGTYEVDGEKVYTVFKGKKGNRKETQVIEKLNDKELILVDEKGKKDTYKRKAK